MMINPIISTRPRSCDISQPQSQDHASQIWRHRPLPARGLTTAVAAAAAGPSKRSGRNFIGSGHSVSSHATARKLSRNCVPAGKRRPQTVAAPPIPRRFTCGVIRRTSSQKRREISGQARDSCRSIPALKNVGRSQSSQGALALSPAARQGGGAVTPAARTPGTCARVSVSHVPGRYDDI
jgi:hypothetical protein